jgi:hypothetical protein
VGSRRHAPHAACTRSPACPGAPPADNRACTCRGFPGRVALVASTRSLRRACSRLARLPPKLPAAPLHCAHSAARARATAVAVAQAVVAPNRRPTRRTDAHACVCCAVVPALAQRLSCTHGLRVHAEAQAAVASGCHLTRRTAELLLERTADPPYDSAAATTTAGLASRGALPSSPTGSAASTRTADLSPSATTSNFNLGAKGENKGERLFSRVEGFERFEVGSRWPASTQIMGVAVK